MKICIPFEGRVRTIIRSSYLAAKRTDAAHYSLTGEAFQMTGITAEQVLLLPDNVEVYEGQEVSDELLMQALPIESFISVSAEEALPNALGLLLRLAVADGKLTDAELLSVKPALEGRLWQPGIEAKVGDVYAYGHFLWRCLQDHTTQSVWPPDITPALWHKVELVSEDTIRVWQAGVEYIVGDEVAYPDVIGTLYICQQAHVSQTGWEPPVAASLWVAKEGEATSDAAEDVAEETTE